MKYLSILFVGIILQIGVSLAASGEPVVWGNSEHGLAARIEMVGSEFSPGKPILLSYIVQNRSKTLLRIWHSGFWPNHQIYVYDQNGKLVARTPFGEERCKAFSPGGSRNKNFPLDIPPGGEDRSDGTSVDIALLYHLHSPGTYTVQALYEEYQGGWEGRLWSNLITIHLASP